MTTVTRPTERSAIWVLESVLGGASSPLTATIEIADRCNEVCVHCYQVQGQKGEMSTDELRTVMDQLADMGVLFLTFSGGEATLRRDFLELVAYARFRRFAVKIYTNGLTMTPELATELANLAVQEVQISLYSHRAEVHDWVTRVPGSFERTVGAVRHLRAVGVHVLVKTPLMSVNADSFREWRDFARELGVDYMMDPNLDDREGGDRSPEAMRAPDEAVKSVYADPEFATLREAPPERRLERSPCGACTAAVHIEANGEVRPCSLLEVPLGNALQEGVAEAWVASDTAKSMRALTWRDHHGCRDCDLQPFCARCYSNARTESGDALGPYASACRRARLHYEGFHGVALRIATAADLTRDPGIGPYRLHPSHVLEPIAHTITSEDERLARTLGWSRVEAGAAASASPEVAVPGQLVQIRRPGKKPTLERIPGPAGGTVSSEEA